MLVLAGRAVGAGAATEFNLAPVEVLVELGPLGGAGIPVFCCRPHGAPFLQVALAD
jgi:hypothetical protein